MPTEIFPPVSGRLTQVAWVPEIRYRLVIKGQELAKVKVPHGSSSGWILCPDGRYQMAPMDSTREWRLYDDKDEEIANAVLCQGRHQQDILLAGLGSTFTIRPCGEIGFRLVEREVIAEFHSLLFDSAYTMMLWRAVPPALALYAFCLGFMQFEWRFE